MHEFSLIADLLRKIESLARSERADRVTCVRVRIGALAHISADHFREHFSDGVRGTRAEGARLEIEVSEDMNDPRAQDILLQSVDVQN